MLFFFGRFNDYEIVHAPDLMGGREGYVRHIPTGMREEVGTMEFMLAGRSGVQELIGRKLQALEERVVADHRASLCPWIDFV